MTREQFKHLHADLRVCVAKSLDFNVLPSETDPTQDIPLRAVQLTASGIPINVKQFDPVFSNIRIEDFTSIERRHTDQFDALGEYQQAVGKVAQKGVTSDYIKPKGKKLKKYD